MVRSDHLILTRLSDQFQGDHPPDKLSDRAIVSGFFLNLHSTIKKPRRKVYSYQNGDYETMRKDDMQRATSSMAARMLYQYRNILI